MPERHPPATPPPAHGSFVPDESELDALLVSRLKAASARPGGMGDPSIRGGAGGAGGALGALIERYQHRIFSICLRMTGNRDVAADLCQDTLLKVILGLDGFDGRSRLSTWVVRIAMNVCLTYLRSARARRTTTTGETLDQSSGTFAAGGGVRGGELSGAERVEQEESRRMVLDALGGLDPEQRAVLVLRDVQGLDYQQVAEVMGVPVGTVKSRLFRARLALRDGVEARRRHA